MKCPDCNGVIEGQRPFCPHCGRKMGGIISGLNGLFSGLAELARSSKGSPVSPAPRTMDDIGKDDENPPFPIPPAYVRAGIFAVIAAILTVIFTDQSWIVSAIIGFYLGMPKSKKSKKP